MPIYEYQCQSCGAHFDKLIRSMKKLPSEISCPVCNGIEVDRLISMPAVHATKSEGGSSEADSADSGDSSPPVFGRKELNAALEKKRQIKEQVALGED